MPREQIQQLNKRPSTEVQMGQFGAGKTQTVAMPVVAPTKSSGAKLAEAFGMAVETGMKVYQMADADRKEKSRLRVQSEKAGWIDELTSLDSDMARAEWIEKKMKSVSSPEVDEHYRNAMIGALNPFYAKYIPAARKEQNLMFQGKATNTIVGMLEEGTFSINELQATPSFSKMDNQYKHPAITNAMTAHYSNKIATATTIEELKQIQTDMNKSISEYSSSTFYGGSQAKKALDLKTKMTTALSKAMKTQTTELGKLQTDKINLMQEQNESYTTVEASIDAHPTWSKDKKETEKLKYKDEYNKYEQMETFKENIDVHSSSNNINYDTYSSEEKKAHKEQVDSNLDMAQNGGMWTSFALTAVKNEAIGKTRMKSTFGNWASDDETTIQRNLTMYKELKNVEHGGRALTFLQPDTLAFYDILADNPQMPVEQLRENIYASKSLNIRYGEPGDSKTKFNKNKKKFDKILTTLSLQEQNTAKRLFRIYSNLMDPSDAVELVERNYVALDSQEAKNGMTFRGFSGAGIDYVEASLKNYIFKDTDYDTDDLHVSMDKGIMTVHDINNPLLPAIQMPYDDFVKATTVFKMQEIEQEEAEVKTKIENVKRFTNSMAHPYYDGGGMFQEGGIFYKPEKQKQAAEDWEEFKDMVGNFVGGLFSPTKAEGSSLQHFNVDNELTKILKSEGGFQAHTEDKGNYVNGKLIGTNKGITPAALAEYRGVKASTITRADIENLSEKEARDIYKKNYYEKPKINQLPVNLQASVMDMYINSGRNGIKILQSLAGVKADGIIGPNTIKAIKKANISSEDYKNARIKYYKETVKKNPKLKKYLNGWINRANKY